MFRERKVTDVRQWPDPALVLGDMALEFKLVYRDEIPSGQGRNKVAIKHQIRQVFSAQLRKLWRTEDRLKLETIDAIPTVPQKLGLHVGEDSTAPFFKVAGKGFLFLPLVSRRNQLSVELMINFLGDSPRVLKPSGDLDNRTKAVIDALRMPRQDSEVPVTGKGELIFCLLEDDSLVRKLCTEVDESLGSPTEHEVSVRVRIVTTGMPHPMLDLR